MIELNMCSHIYIYPELRTNELELHADSHSDSDSDLFWRFQFQFQLSCVCGMWDQCGIVVL